MQDVAEAPPDALPNLVKGRALFPLDDGGGLEAKQIDFETVPFPGSASADVIAILRFIQDVKKIKPTRAQEGEDFAMFEEILAKAFQHHADDPPLSKDGTALWIPHLDFLQKALAGAQQVLVEHDRAFTLPPHHSLFPSTHHHHHHSPPSVAILAQGTFRAVATLQA